MAQVFSIFSNIILPIMFILITGYVLQKLIKFDPAVFTKIIFYILAPSLIFSRIYMTTLSFREFAAVVMFAMAIIILMGLLSYPVSLVRKSPPSMRAALRCTSPINAPGPPPTIPIFNFRLSFIPAPFNQEFAINKLAKTFRLLKRSTLASTETSLSKII